MLLTIDIGNTRIKCAVFEQNTLFEKFVFTKEDALKNFKKILKKNKTIEFSISSSVGKLEKECLEYINAHSKLIIVSHELIFPFKNLYSTPKTLGIDRMVLAAGANLLYPNSNCLIIDAGTCVTYDFIDDNNYYLGGAISPGINLRYQALHNYTAKLPLLEKKDINQFIGISTDESIHSGIVNGLVYEIEGFVTQYFHKYEHLTIILTGGDADFLAKRLKSTIFANSNFLLESLNLLFNYVQTQND
ncbi:type III pantothenate kinase [Flavobacterium jejuense]|uniref:Type III pantothenate kinase n=1 Tax=Flavobacterium jejuense TaxID=1544455 RepID=A0ABX0J094_9FLAO|nr:type III pantothenate kinase [Flavobacterium jejuense]NHN27414.1 type III pantothenate kinase [Flavobacterium jejuense]